MKNLSNKLLNFIEQKYKKYYPILHIGDFIKICFQKQNLETERNTFFSGTLIAIKNKNLKKSITIRQKSKELILNHNFFINSPKIQIKLLKNTIKTKRAKLYFLKKF